MLGETAKSLKGDDWPRLYKEITKACAELGTDPTLPLERAALRWAAGEVVYVIGPEGLRWADWRGE